MNNLATNLPAIIDASLPASYGAARNAVAERERIHI